MDALRKVRAGDPFQPSAGTHNEMIDLLVRARGRQHVVSPPITPAADDTGVIQILNDTASPLRRYAVVGLEEPVILPGDNEGSFLNDLALRAVEPEDSHALRFAIVRAPIAPGGVGEATISGIAITKVADGVRDGCCGIAAGQTTHLVGGAGHAAILWIDDDQEATEQWAVVQLGAAGRRIIALIESSPAPSAIVANQQWRYTVTEQQRAWDDTNKIFTYSAKSGGYSGFATNPIEHRTVEEYEGYADACEGEGATITRAPIPPGTLLDCDLVGTPDGLHAEILGIRGATHNCCGGEE